MSYYYATPSVAGSEAGYVSAMATALANQGWTLVDNVASNNQVYAAPNLNGISGFTFYIQLKGNGGGSVAVNGMQDYDASAHTAISASAGVNFLAVAGNGYIRANPFSCFFYVHDGTYNKCLWFGLPRTIQQRGASDGITLTTATITAGASSVTVQDNVSAQLYVGQAIAIQNFAHNNSSANKSNRELVFVSSVSSGAITITGTFANNYDSGAKIGPPDLLIGVGGSTNAFPGYNGTVLQISEAWTDLAQIQTSNIFEIGGSWATGWAATSQHQNNVGLPPPVWPAFAATSQASWTGQQGVAHHLIFASIDSGGPATTGTKWTDGTDVYIQMGATVSSGSNPTPLLGPTGDSPNFGTMSRLSAIQFVPPNDTLYVQPPPVAPMVSEPTNGLNMGLN